ncbi:hypothetical protein KY284_001423 [Solanum tuberosum]|nr:hypothetical protein KY284_001423 [Solanum tuberosum]
MRLYLWLTFKHNLRDKYLMLRLNCPLQVRINALVCWHAQIVSNCSRDITCEGKSTAQVVTNPHILFLVTIKDNNGFATAIVSDEIAEKMLHLTSEDIYEICFVKKETLLLQNVEDQLNGKIFNIQMKRLFTKKLDATQKLFILSYLDKQDLEHFCCGSRNDHFLHSFAAATECCVLQASDAAMWMPCVPVLLWKLKIFSPVIPALLLMEMLNYLYCD